MKEGYVIKGHKGIFYGRILKPDGKWTRYSLKTKVEKDAYTELGKLLARLKREGFYVTRSADAPCLADVILPYLNAKAGRDGGAASWLAKQRQYLVGPIGKFLGEKTKINAITTAQIAAYRDHRKQQVRGTTVNKELSVLRSLYNWLTSEECIFSKSVRTNPAAKVTFLRDKSQIIERFLDEEEYQFLVGFSEPFVEGDPYFHIGNHFRDLKEYIRFMAHTGLRLGESLFAEFSDVKNGKISVRPKPDFGFDTKSHKPRLIPLCSQAVEAVKSMQEKRSPDPACNFIFWRHGQKYSKKNRTALADYHSAKRDVQESFSRLIAAASKEMPSLHDVTIHTLRKTFGSWLVQRGATMKEVKELLGHSTIELTDKIYGHLAKKNLEIAISKLEGVTTTVSKTEKEMEVKKAVSSKE